MHCRIQSTALRQKNPQAKVHHLQNLRRWYDHCPGRIIPGDRLRSISQEAFLGGWQRWKPDSAVCRLRRRIWSWKRRKPVWAKHIRISWRLTLSLIILLYSTKSIFIHWGPSHAPIKVSPPGLSVPIDIYQLTNPIIALHALCMQQRAAQKSAWRQNLHPCR
jgi:hypothetical protein